MLQGPYTNQNKLYKNAKYPTTFHGIYFTFPDGAARVGREVLDENQGRQETMHL